MSELVKKWVVAPPLPPEADSQLSSYHPLLRQILYNRGYASPAMARVFLEAQPPPGTDPRSLKGIPQAAERIQRAIRQGEKIAVYGDYDADGVTATALLVEVLTSLGADPRGYIPNRFDEGYGLNIEALKVLKDEGVRLVITVDCGIRSVAEVDYAAGIGLDVIITDHHHPAGEIPRAIVINPKQPGDDYPDKNLAGVGLAYKLAQQLLEHASADPPSSEDYLDLVAVGTIADLAPLNGENRALVRKGLLALRKPQRPGLLSLIGVSGLKPARLNATDIGFGVGPRLNAAGRLDTALTALDLLLTRDPYKAAHLAQELDSQNRERQRVTRQIQAAAEQMVSQSGEEPWFLFAASPEFNSGVVGLAASRLVESHYRPAAVAYQGEEFTRGSCRSIPEFHITAALDQCADLLEHHGGHAAAAGFTVRNEHLPELVERLQAIAHAQLSETDLVPTLHADAEVKLSSLKTELLEYLEWLQPTGYGNLQPVFMTRKLKRLRDRAVGADLAHLKLVLTDGYVTFDAIAFRQGHWYGKVPDYIDVMYTFELNEFNGQTTLQLNVRDLRPAER